MHGFGFDLAPDTLYVEARICARKIETDGGGRSDLVVHRVGHTVSALGFHVYGRGAGRDFDPIAAAVRRFDANLIAVPGPDHNAAPKVLQFEARVGPNRHRGVRLLRQGSNKSKQNVCVHPEINSSLSCLRCATLWRVAATALSSSLYSRGANSDTGCPDRSARPRVLLRWLHRSCADSPRGRRQLPDPDDCAVVAARSPASAWPLRN